MKETKPANVVKAIRCVLEGGIYLSDSMSSRLLEMVSGHGSKATLSPLERLSDREIEVFQLIGGGKASREIAEQLSISGRTVDAHRTHIKEKLNLKSGSELTRYAVRWVETGQAPEKIVASHPPGDDITRSRPLCAYPQLAIYKGTGSTDEAGSFECQLQR